MPKDFWKGKKFSKEHKENISAGLMDYEYTDRHKQRLRDAKKKQWQKIKEALRQTGSPSAN